MKKILLLLCFIPIACFGQNLIVEKVQLKETIDNESVSEIPRVRALTPDKIKVAENINAEIRERFMISSFVQSELKEFRWYDVGFTSELEGDMLYIGFAGEYYGAYPNYVEDEMYFSTTTGVLITPQIIPFQALFSLSGYLDFMNKYWLKGVKEAFKEAIECADYEPYCSYYDIYSYTAKNNKLSISLADDCYARVSSACSPGFSIEVELDSISSYLNKVGNRLLIESNYMSMSHIQKFHEIIRLKPTVPNYYFLFGKINDRFPISMAIEINDQSKISGYYYYDNKRIKIDLQGQVIGDEMLMTETVDGKKTGSFELTRKNKYDEKGYMLYDRDGNTKYLLGKWYTPDKSKSFDVMFSEVKLPFRN